MSIREYKFRGKSIETREWVYGYLYIDKDGYHYILRDIRIKLKPDYWANSYGYPPGEEDFYIEGMVDVHSKTVGQFTGLTDKNGKEIYEGDIVRVSKENPVLLQVVWYKGRFRLQDFYNKRYSSITYIHIYELIGNIHDNPELLEES